MSEFAGYTLLTPEELVQLSKDYPEPEDLPGVMKAALKTPEYTPAVCIDFEDGRRVYYTLETSREAEKLQDAADNRPTP
jgi:hypothetical protein